MEKQDFIKNEKCFVRKDHDCGRYFGVSKTCFVACPDSEEIGLELEVIKGKLHMIKTGTDLVFEMEIREQVLLYKAAI